MKNDFDLSDQGSLVILTPLSAQARDWVAEFLPEDVTQWAGGVVIEHRFVDDIVSGIQADGLTIG